MTSLELTDITWIMMDYTRRLNYFVKTLWWFFGCKACSTISLTSQLLAANFKLSLCSGEHDKNGFLYKLFDNCSSEVKLFGITFWFYCFRFRYLITLDYSCCVLSRLWSFIVYQTLSSFSEEGGVGHFILCCRAPHC